MSDKPKIVLPGKDRGPRPVDPSDPTKGVIQNVYSAPQLSAAVDELAERSMRLVQGLGGMSEGLHAVAADTGRMVEYIAVLLLPLVEMNKHELTDAEDEAVEALRSFLDERATLRAEVEAEMARLEEARDAAEAGEQPNLFVAD